MRKFYFILAAILAGGFAKADTIVYDSGAQYQVPSDRKAITVPKDARMWKLYSLDHNAGVYYLNKLGAVNPRKLAEVVGECSDFDFYDFEGNGLIDAGPAKGCQYDPCEGPASCYD